MMTVINYKTILKVITRLLNLRLEITYFDRSNEFQVYVTNWKVNGKKHNVSFGFWKNNTDLNMACKEVLLKLFPNILWAYKTRIKKWLRK